MFPNIIRRKLFRKHFFHLLRKRMRSPKDDIRCFLYHIFRIDIQKILPVAISVYIDTSGKLYKTSDITAFCCHHIRSRQPHQYEHRRSLLLIMLLCEIVLKILEFLMKLLCLFFFSQHLS